MSNELAVLETQLQPLAPHFAQVLGKTMPVERLMRTVMISVERLPQLLTCDRQSIFNAAMSAACLGLEVDGVTGQAYLIPFKGRVQLVIGYKGYNTLAARSGITITGAVVREGDEFDYQLGSSAYVMHKPKGGKGAITHAWACAQSMDRPAVVEVLDYDELLAIRARSPGASRSDSPWNDPAIGFPAMCQKTAKRRLARSMPLNVMQQAARLDEAVDEQGASAWISPDKGVVIDGEFSEPSPTIHHEQRSTQELISSQAGTRATEKAGPATTPATTDPQAGPADDVPTAAEYIHRWLGMVEDRDPQMKQMWADEIPMRKKIEWPAGAFIDLQRKVRVAIEQQQTDVMES